jgi:Tfp pilus assembly protein PilO
MNLNKKRKNGGKLGNNWNNNTENYFNKSTHFEVINEIQININIITMLLIKFSIIYHQFWFILSNQVDNYKITSYSCS